MSCRVILVFSMLFKWQEREHHRVNKRHLGVVRILHRYLRLRRAGVSWCYMGNKLRVYLVYLLQDLLRHRYAVFPNFDFHNWALNEVLQILHLLLRALVFESLASLLSFCQMLLVHHVLAFDKKLTLVESLIWQLSAVWFIRRFAPWLQSANSSCLHHIHEHFLLQELFVVKDHVATPFRMLAKSWLFWGNSELIWVKEAVVYTLLANFGLRRKLNSLFEIWIFLWVDGWILWFQSHNS